MGAEVSHNGLSPNPSSHAKATDESQSTTNPTFTISTATSPSLTPPVESALKTSPGMFVQLNQGAFCDRYRGLKILGKGSFGEVVLCRNRLTGQECAVKVINKKNVKTKDNTYLEEVRVLKQLDHPNIMKLFEVYDDGKYFYLVGEYYSGGELFDRIVEKKRFDEADAAHIISQILSGISYMHSHKIVHRDLKPENLLLESTEPDALIKIIDFGLSTLQEGPTGQKLRDKIGTAYYIAPEVLRGTYDEKCDVWSIGVILYILLSGRPPFAGATENEILQKVQVGKYTFQIAPWYNVSESAKDLIRRMLFFLSSMRLSAKQALGHDWIRDMTAARVAAGRDRPDLPLLESTVLNMRKFQGTQKFAQAALMFIGSRLATKDEINQLTRIFRQLDKNHDGQLDREELVEGYQELLKLKNGDGAVETLDQKVVEEEVDQVLAQVDFDHSGYIEYSEFLTVALDKGTLLSKARLKTAFDAFDLDNSGKISTDEIARVFEVGNLNLPEIEDMLSKIDKNHDGEVDFDEFVTMLRGMCGEPTESMREISNDITSSNTGDITSGAIEEA